MKYDENLHDEENNGVNDGTKVGSCPRVLLIEFNQLQFNFPVVM